jgi:ketosteroid isomerase-like protein
VTADPQEIYRRYLMASAFSRDPDAVAGMFTDDGVLEAPLVPPGHAYPQHLEGRGQIREGLAAYYQRSPGDTGTGQQVDTGQSRFVLHTTADPSVFIAEIDTVLVGPAGTTTMSLVQIFRTRDGKIAMMRDYFAPEHVT